MGNSQSYKVIVRNKRSHVISIILVYAPGHAYLETMEDVGNIQLNYRTT